MLNKISPENEKEEVDKDSEHSEEEAKDEVMSLPESVPVTVQSVKILELEAEIQKEKDA